MIGGFAGTRRVPRSAQDLESGVVAVAYRISYLDARDAPRLVAVAETLADARTVAGQVTAAVPQAADRLVLAEDPLLGVASQVVQPPRSLDAASGLSVLYLGGTISPAVDWQARAIRVLSAVPVVIANPRRERPAASDGELLVQLAWQRRHLWRADIGLFWFEGADPDPMTLLEFGTVLGSPLPMAIGVSPDFALRTALRANIGHLLPERIVHETLSDAVAAAVELVHERPRPVLYLPHHDRDPAASAMSVQVAIVRLEHGRPGLDMRLNELVIEVGCAAGNGIDPRLLARIYMGADRLRLDGDDPLGWAELLDAGHALEDY